MSDAHDQVILLRAHRCTPGLGAALARYAEVAGHDVFVLYDNDRRDFVPFGLPTLLLTSEDLQKTDLPYRKGDRHFGLWKNGDYALYQALAQLEKPYAFYWLIEYDVFINFEDVNDFFSIFRGHREDLLAPYLGPRSGGWMWAQHLDWLAQPVYGCFFPVLRLSAPALHYCHLARRYYGRRFRDLGLRGPSWPHCEAFVPTQLTQAGFALRDLNDFGRTFCDTAWFHARTEEGLRLDSPCLTRPDGRLYHPVYPE